MRETYPWVDLLRFRHGVVRVGMNPGGIIQTSPLCVKAQVQNNQRSAQFSLALQINRYSWAFTAAALPFFQTEIRNHLSTATYSLIVHQLPLMNERPGNFTRFPSATNEVPVQMAPTYRGLFNLSLLRVIFRCPSLPLFLALSSVVLAQCRWFLLPAETQSACG